MTDDQENAVIGRKYLEREEAQKRLARLDQKSLCMEATLQEVMTALKTRRDGEGTVLVPSEFPRLDDIQNLLEEQAKEQAVIRNVDRFFKARQG